MGPFVIPQLFKNACAELGVEFILHDAATERLAPMKSLGKNDLLYRSATSARSVLAERIMLSAECSNFYTDWTSGFNTRNCSFFLHEKIGLPVIPTVPFIPTLQTGVADAVEKLGGFPIIVKALGGSHGVGVMRADSMQGLASLLDFLRAEKTSVLLRKFIPHSYYARIVVVGNKVVASHLSYTIENEFRTNAGDDKHQKREAITFPADIQEIAVKAVLSLGMETGGVDILFDTQGKPYIAEVNFPNDFSVTQRVAGIDIAKAMIEHLMNKQSFDQQSLS